MTISKRCIAWLRMAMAALALGMSASALSHPHGYGYGYGQGMMGLGMGPGMMGPGMMGPGMMGPGMPDLNDAQRAQIAKIQDELRTKQTELALKQNEEQARLQSLWATEKPDAAQIREQTRKVFDLQRQMADAMHDARIKMDAMLTKEQRDRMWRQGGWRGGR